MQVNEANTGADCEEEAAVGMLWLHTSPAKGPAMLAPRGTARYRDQPDLGTLSPLEWVVLEALSLRRGRALNNHRMPGPSHQRPFPTPSNCPSLLPRTRSPVKCLYEQCCLAT